MCISLDHPNEASSPPPAQNNDKIREQLRVYDSECERGVMHTRSYSIKMEQYRLTLVGQTHG